MQLFGHQQGTDAEEPMSLEEVTILASAATLRRLAQFLLHAAAEMDRHGRTFGHEHFSDFAHEMRSEPAFVVAQETERDPRRGPSER